MPVNYLQSQDYSAYGVPNTTTADQVTYASNIINGYLQRPEGLLWAPDGNGNPCYMLGLSPAYSLTVTSGAVTPGNNIQVTVTGPIARVQTGAPLILDRANANLTEAVIVTNVTGNILTLQTVQFTHDVNALLEFDLVIVEETNLSDNRMEIVLSRRPIAGIIAGQGQFGYPRQGSSYKFDYSVYSLLPILTQFGGPPIWQSFTVTPDSYDANTGRIWTNPSVYLAYYTQVRMYYVSGFQYANLPSQIKQACANIINIQNDTPIYGNFKSVKQGDTAISYWGNTIIDGDTIQLLDPFRVNSWV
jgi:hypothetical protein